jgi:BlaI family penicillinase repressor
LTKLTKLELTIMKTVWTKGPCSIREIHEAFPKAGRPAFTTVQTTVYRLERKNALRQVKRIGKANIFDAAISQNDAERGLVHDLLEMLSGRGKPVMAHLVEAGAVTLEDVKEAEETLRRLKRKERRR